MSAHTKTHPIKNSNALLCISEEGQLYKLPSSLLNQYIVHNSDDYEKAKKRFQHTFSITPEEVFAEINKKYTKTGALLKGIRLREGLTQKEFATLIEVTQGDLSKMELGKRPIGKILISRIAKKFGSRIR